jgi:hypothetical protein
MTAMWTYLWQSLLALGLLTLLGAMLGQVARQTRVGGRR